LSEERLEKVEVSRLPFLYRLLLKFPNVKIESLPSMLQGMYWAVILPILVGTETLVTFCLIAFIPPPMNLIAALAIPAVIFIVFVKIMLERFIDWWNGLVGNQTNQWNVSQKVTEYKELLDKSKKRD
jgi:hypothetical protein